MSLAACHLLMASVHAEARTMEQISVGPFILEAPIGKGGMGQVWRGVHVAQKTQVAVKVLTREASRREDYVASFHTEIASIARLIHPSIVVVLDYGELDARAEAASGHELVAGSPFIVMELGRRGSLHDHQHTLRWPELRAVLFTVLDALAHAHARGVIHRDLKPQNILLGCGPHDAIKLTDFGLAHLLDEAESRRGEVEQGWGTPHYMAPEQFRGSWRDYGPWTDLYALGCMAFELASGQLPFGGQTTWDFGRAHILQEVPPLVPRFEVPDELERWIVRLLQKEPERRFQRAADAAAALARIDQRFEAQRREARRAFLGTSLPSAALCTSPHDALTAPAHDVATDAGGVGAATLPMVSWVEPVGSAVAEAMAPLSGAAPALPPTWRRAHQPELVRALAGAGLGLYGLREVPLVGRDAELDVLWRALGEAVAAGEPRAVVLEGEAGVGKSRLAEWLCERVHELGCGTPLRAQHGAQPQRGDGVVAMCLRHLRLLGLESPVLEERVASALRRLGLDEDSGAPGGLVALLTTGGAGMAQAQRHGLLRRFFAALAEERPLVIWLDDAHRSVETLMCARSLLQSVAERLPALLVLTSRPELDAADSALESLLLDDLCRQPTVRRVEVKPLGDAASQELVEALLGLEPALARQVAVRAGGVPLFAVQLVGDWVRRGLLEPGPGGFTLRAGHPPELPDDLHALWQARLDRFLSGRAPADRVALEVVACLGGRATAAEWLLAAQFCGVMVDPALEPALIAAGLALPGEAGGRGVALAHGLLTESLARSVRERGRWAQTHRACATMLDALYSESGRREHERLAHHLIEAGGLEEALIPLREAALQRMARAELELAMRLIDAQEQLLVRLRAPEEDGRWALCWELRARVLDMQGRSLEAMRAASRALVQARRHGHRDAVLLATLTCAEASLHRGGTDEAERGFEEARLMLGEEAEQTVLWMRAALGLGRVAERRGELERAEALFRGALWSAEQLGEDAVRAACLNALGDVARRGGRWEAAHGFAEQALMLARRLGDRLLEADCLNDLAELARKLRREQEAELLCEQAAALYALVGSAQRQRVLLNLGFVRLSAHDYGRAREVLEPLVEALASAQEHGQLALAVTGMVACYAASREWDAVFFASARAQRLLEQTGRRHPDVALAASLALRIARAEGAPEGVERELVRLGALAEPA
jgi:tetratricopeptide (TPR) repeat protein